MRIGCFLVVAAFSVVFVQAQGRKDVLTYSLSTRANAGSGGYAPFLSTANAYDRFSMEPNSLTIWGVARKEMNGQSRFDYGFGTELDANLAKPNGRFFPNELYVEGKAYFLTLTMGMKQKVYGNQDPELSSGGMIWSKNSRPLPGIALETNDYVKVPYTRGYVEVKGGISHAWFSDSSVVKNALLHYKYAFVRFGGKLPININFGLHHVCQWAGTSPKYGTSPANWSNFRRIFFGKNGSSSSPQTEQDNALGNHIISKNLGLDVRFKPVEVSLYWQNIYEDPPVMNMFNGMNSEDGLFGASMRLRRFKPLNRLVVEYLSTTDQSGPWHDLDGVIYGGADSYYVNGVYQNGWTYYGMTIGNPWLTSPKYNKNGMVQVLNNKVRLYYVSGTGCFWNVTYRATFAYSRNWGSSAMLYDACKRQYSYQLELEKPIRCLRNTTVCLGFSGDKGRLYGDNFAALLGMRYSGIK